MSDLIKKSDAIKAVANYLWHYPNEQYKNLNVFEIGESLVKDALSIVPSADRPTGEWIRNDNGTYSCCVCQSWIPEEQHGYARYCLYCGAKMYKGGEDE